MRTRAPSAVIGWSVASGGAYAVAWLCQTRGEMNRLGARIPSPWLLAVPVAALYWAWCWAEGVRHVTAGRTSTLAAFALLCLGGPLGMACVQARLNALAHDARRRRAGPACCARTTARRGIRQ
jgi:hypothetical protein